jgi:ribonuclease-3 family protein
MDYNQLNGLSLAYLGDAVFELSIREYLLNKGYTKVNVLNKRCVEYTSGKNQALFIYFLINDKILTENEIQVYKRGRNSHINSVRKNIDIETYLSATGFEALIGYLYLSNKERLDEIINLILKWKEDKDSERH